MLSQAEYVACITKIHDKISFSTILSPKYWWKEAILEMKKVKHGYEQFLSALLPLDKLRFNLPANLAIRNLDEINHAF